MKLTERVKNDMIQRIVCDKFDIEEAGDAAAFTVLADDIYNSFHDICRVSEVPSGWLPKDLVVRVVFGAYRISLKMSEERPMPFTLFDARQCFGSDHPFTIRFNSLVERESKTRELKRELERELRTVLRGVNTDKQLLSIWPEAKRWLPDASLQLPAVVSVDRLKRMLGESV